MPWWGWVLLIVGMAWGLALLVLGAYVEQGHRLAELGHAIRRDTPAYLPAPTTGNPLSMCIGCGQTDSTHVDRFGSPCPYGKASS